MDVNHNMLYPTLRKFTEEGFVRKHRNEQEGRPNQYVYEITETGREKSQISLTNSLKRCKTSNRIHG